MVTIERGALSHGEREHMEQAHYDIREACAALRALATCNISCSEAIEGTTVDWLARQIETALDAAEG